MIPTDEHIFSGAGVFVISRSRKIETIWDVSIWSLHLDDDAQSCNVDSEGKTNVAPHQWNDKPKRGIWVIKPSIRDSELGREISRRIYPPRFMLDRFITNAYLKDIMLDTD